MICEVCASNRGVESVAYLVADIDRHGVRWIRLRRVLCEDCVAVMREDDENYEILYNA